MIIKLVKSATNQEIISFPSKNCVFHTNSSGFFVDGSLVYDNLEIVGVALENDNTLVVKVKESFINFACWEDFWGRMW